jgi:hypothetical protein
VTARSPGEPLLTPRALNRTLLARQLLLERSTGPIVDAVEQAGGLQTQYAPSGYVGLWTPVAGFELPEAHRPRVFSTKNPFSVGVYLVDGRGAGARSLVDGRITLDPFEQLSKTGERAVERERAAVEAFHA